MTTSHTAKSGTAGAAGLTPLDSASALVLARLEQFESTVLARVDALEQLARTSHSPTALAHHLMQLEEHMLQRLKFMSELMSFMMNKTGGYLQRMSEETESEGDPMALALEAFKLASETKVDGIKGGGAPARKPTRGRKK